MIDSITTVQYSGYFQTDIRKILNNKKTNPENEEVKIQNFLEEERKRVQPVYNLKGKLIGYKSIGRHLNVLV